MSEVEIKHLFNDETRDLGGGRTHAIRYREDGSIIYEWYLNGKSHREDGPADMNFILIDGSYREHWYLNGQLHREDGPAITVYLKDGSVEREYWSLNGQYHREDGPAWITYHEDGSVRSEDWYLFGKGLRVRTLKGLKKKLPEMICQQVHDS